MSISGNCSHLKDLGKRTSMVLGREELLGMRAKALKRGLWFKVLSGVERAMVDLAIKVVRDRVKSSKLARLMQGVVTKLMKAMESQIVRVAREVGRPVAYRLSRIALAWGNQSAFLWVRDARFIRYLTVMYMNSPEAFG